MDNEHKFNKTQENGIKFQLYKALIRKINWTYDKKDAYLEVDLLPEYFRSEEINNKIIDDIINNNIIKKFYIDNQINKYCKTIDYFSFKLGFENLLKTYQLMNANN
jgi:hypothetical protein